MCVWCDIYKQWRKKGHHRAKHNNSSSRVLVLTLISCYLVWEVSNVLFMFIYMFACSVGRMLLACELFTVSQCCFSKSQLCILTHFNTLANQEVALSLASMFAYGATCAWHIWCIILVCELDQCSLFQFQCPTIRSEFGSRFSLHFCMGFLQRLFGFAPIS